MFLHVLIALFFSCLSPRLKVSSLGVLTTPHVVSHPHAQVSSDHVLLSILKSTMCVTIHAPRIASQDQGFEC